MNKSLKVVYLSVKYMAKKQNEEEYLKLDSVEIARFADGSPIRLDLFVMDLLEHDEVLAQELLRLIAMIGVAPSEDLLKKSLVEYERLESPKTGNEHFHASGEKPRRKVSLRKRPDWCHILCRPTVAYQ